MSKPVRVRFAPSPTGGLHLGGVRTVLYNYLFARQNNGRFILRIEDTDQQRFVPGAEEYIYESLAWCGLEPDESPKHGGEYGPYRQSERKQIYFEYAQQLVRSGHAYYAFDTPEELEAMRDWLRTDENPSPQYDHRVRTNMKNSLTLPADEVQARIDSGEKFVVRICMPENETVRLMDMIRGEVEFHTGLVDDKVLLKADGMPTYHLAVVVDDYLMKITHAFRGEEWLPSAPVHVLLWRYLSWEKDMPAFAHLPLILGPHGKLSKRDAARYGFPVFVKNWSDPASGELTEGFLERGFLPEAFLNFLALLGWNDGTDQEIFSLEQLVDRFSLERVHSGGARFDFEKAKWFNHEWIRRLPVERLQSDVRPFLNQKGISDPHPSLLARVIALVRDRCTLLSDFYEQSWFFFAAPTQYDTPSLPNWSEKKAQFFLGLADELNAVPTWNSAFIEDAFKKLAAVHAIRPGELQLPLRMMLVGKKFGPPVFDIADLIGQEETCRRIRAAVPVFGNA